MSTLRSKHQFQRLDPRCCLYHQSVLGGFLGVAAGYGAANLMTRIAKWDTAVAPEAVAAAIGFSAAVGLFFGIWPARRAALLDPIDALRYE